MERTARGYWLAVAAIVAAGLVLRWYWFAPFDISHADELMQYLEQGKRLATGSGIVPWEYRYGARNGLIPQLLALPWWLGEAIAPGTQAPMLAARWWFLGLTLMALPAAWRLGALTGRWHGLMALLVTALWWESAFFATLLLSETLGAALFLCAAALLIDAEKTPKKLRWAGLLLGLAVIVRLQFAPAAAALVLAALGRDWRTWPALIQGGLIAAAIGAISDLAMGRIPFEWIWTNIQFNVGGEDRAARFGANGPFDYLIWIRQHLGMLWVAIVPLAMLAPARYRPLLWAAAANLLFHSLVTHKEYRFVWLTVLALLIVAAIGSVDVVERRLAAREPAARVRACALIAFAWLAGSMISLQQSGGPRAYRGGAPIPLAAIDADRRAETCGIAIPNQWRAHLVPALLPRDIPLYVADAAVVDRNASLPADLQRAANALVFDRLPTGAAGYRAVSCRSNGAIRACLYVRPGRCSSAARYGYQAALQREDL